MTTDAIKCDPGSAPPAKLIRDVAPGYGAVFELSPPAALCPISRGFYHCCLADGPILRYLLLLSPVSRDFGQIVDAERLVPLGIDVPTLSQGAGSCQVVVPHYNVDIQTRSLYIQINASRSDRKSRLQHT